LEKSKGEIRNTFKNVLEKVIEKINPKSGVERRVCKSYAAIVLTAQI